MREVQYGLETLDLKNEKNKISFHDLLRKGVIEENLIEKLKKDQSDTVPFIYPPIFLKKKDKYYLVARHFSYSLILHRGILSVPSLVFFDESLIDKILDMEKKEILLFSGSGSTEPQPLKNIACRATSSKRAALSSGRTCPFCGVALRAPKDIKKARDKEYIVMTCPNKECNFQAKLTDFEFHKFRKYDLPTEKWIVKTGSKCPRCNKDLYKRIMYKSETDVKYLEICKDRIPKEIHCEYLKYLAKA